MYKKPLKKLMWGDYYNPDGSFGGNKITNASPYIQMGSTLIDSLDVPNEYGVRSGAGAAFSGLAKGVATGAAAGVPGMIVGGVAGLIGGIFNNKKAKEAQEKAEEAERQAKLNRLTNYSKGVLSTYPSYGIMEAKYGMKLPMGGALPYPTDDSSVEKLSSNMAVYSGDTHENGGIPIDTNMDGSPEVEIEDAEVIKDDFVLSDRIKPSSFITERLKGLGVNIKNSDSYASLAERFGKKKGEYEEKLTSSRIGEAGTAKLMIQQLDEAVNMLFEDQQNQKEMNNIGQYAYGGGLSRSKDYGSKSKPYPSVKSSDFAGGGRSYPIPTKADAIDALKLAGLHGRSDVIAKVYAKYPDLKKGYGGYLKMYALGDPLPKTSNNSLYSDLTVKGQMINPRPDFVPGQFMKRKTGLEWLGAPIPMNERQQNALRVATSTSLMRRSYGGYLKKYNTGGPIRDAQGNIFDPELEQRLITNNVNNYMNNIGVDVNSNEVDFGGMQSDIASFVNQNVPNEEAQTYRPSPSLGERVRENLGNIATGVGFLANQAQIGKLETEYTPDLIRTPNYNFTSRLPYLRSAVSQAYRTASQGARGSSAQDNQALKANLYAKSLESLNKATADEFAREDAFKRDYNQSLLRTDLANAEMTNRARFASMDNRNQRRALTQQNIDSLIRGVQGNQAMKEARELDFMKNFMELSKSGDRGVSERWLKSLSPELRRRYYGNYYPLK
jgi:hypothetical protein